MGRRKLKDVEKNDEQNLSISLLLDKKDIIAKDEIETEETKTSINNTITGKKRGRKQKIIPDILDNDNGDIPEKSLNGKITIYKNINISKQEKKVINLPFTEKYRPKTIDDIILDDCLKEKIKNLVKSNLLPNLIITGSSGTGKTSTMFCIARYILGDKYNDGLLELNASDNRGLEIINNSIIHFCKKKINNNIDELNDSTLSENNIKKIIIFDEADNITKKAQNILANMMEEYTNSTRFCFTCNDSSKIIESIQSRCLILHYRPMNKNNIKKHLEHICKLENIKYTNDGIDSIIFISQGDIRQAINNLEAIYNSYGRITDEFVYKICYQPHPNTIISLIQTCVLKNLNQAIMKYNELKLQGYCNSDILQTIINVLKIINIDENIRINFIKILSDIYLIVTDGIDTNLQMYSCISKMINYMAMI
jgi:replication factor C subunit 2/4